MALQSSPESRKGGQLSVPLRGQATGPGLPWGGHILVHRSSLQGRAKPQARTPPWAAAATLGGSCRNGASALAGFRVPRPTPGAFVQGSLFHSPLLSAHLIPFPCYLGCRGGWSYHSSLFRCSILNTSAAEKTIQFKNAQTT